MSNLPGITVSLIISLYFISKLTIKRNECILYVMKCSHEIYECVSYVYMK